VNGFERLVDDALALLWATHPVTASFAGEVAYDAALPPVGANAIERERAELDSLARRLEDVAVPSNPGARIDARFMRAFVEQTRAELAARTRLHNPAWYTGEAAFGIIALLLRDEESRDDHALHARIAAIPELFAAGRSQLHDRPLPRGWVERARVESLALVRLLRVALPLHPWATPAKARALDAAVDAVERFAAALSNREDADPACGATYLTSLMQSVHGLAETSAELERRAASAYAIALAELEEAAARTDASATWREQLARLAAIVPEPGGTLDAFRMWNARASDDARTLLAPQTNDALTFAPLPHWARVVAADLYFLFYRSPAARRPRAGNTYWVDGEPSIATIKLVHAVHHGSVGHHTQNAYARGAASRFARVAGTDGASALALLSAGTMVEGWACYAEDLMAEIPGFYTPAERMQLQYFTLRNIACCLADIRLHTSVWSIDEMQRFYRDDVAFAPSRIVAETTRNSIFPGSRLMYWTGTTQIAELRARSPLLASTFHDRLLSFGSAPVAWIGEEMDA